MKKLLSKKLLSLAIPILFMGAIVTSYAFTSSGKKFATWKCFRYSDTDNSDKYITGSYVFQTTPTMPPGAPCTSNSVICYICVDIDIYPSFVNASNQLVFSSVPEGLNDLFDFVDAALATGSNSYTSPNGGVVIWKKLSP